MPSRRRASSRLLAAAALVPPVVWLLPALLRRQAPTLRDQADFFFPLKLHTMARLLAGEIPLWNPLSGAGEPWLANAQSGVFYPPTLLFAVPSAALAAALFLLLHFAIGAGGVWRFCKDEGTTDGAALFAALVWTASGPSASLSAYWNHFGGFAYLPAICALARAGLQTRRSGVVFAGLVGLQAMAGSPEASLATLAVAVLFAANPRPQPDDIGWRPAAGSPVRRLAMRAALGLALAAWLLVPLAELVVHSQRVGSLPSAERDSGAIPPADVAGLLALSAESGRNSYLASLAFGPLALLAAAAAFAEPERRRLATLVAALAAAGLLLAVGPPPGAWLRALPGLDRIRYPSKALAVTSFGVAVLGGLGADAVRFRATGRSRWILVGGAGVAAAVALLASASAPARVAALSGVAAFALLAVMPRRRPALGALLQGIAAIALGVSLVLASRGIFRFAPEAEIGRGGEAAARLAALPGRVLTPPMIDLAHWVLRDDRYDAATLRRQRATLLGYTNLLSGVRTLRTAAALPTAAAGTIAQSIDTSREPPAVARAAGAASGRALWTPFQPDGWGSQRMKDGFFLAPVNPYRPRLSFVGRHRVESDADRAWRLASAGSADPSRAVALDREPAVPPGGGKGGRGYVIARLAEDRPERVQALVVTSTPGFLVLTDLFYPGWTVQVDGRAAPLLRADGFFRAVALGPGEHRVVFRYRPVSFYGGAAVSLLALVVLLFELSRGERVPVFSRRSA